MQETQLALTSEHGGWSKSLTVQKGEHHCTRQEHACARVRMHMQSSRGGEHLRDSIVVGDDIVAGPALAAGAHEARGPALPLAAAPAKALPVCFVALAVLLIAPELAHLRPQLLIGTQLNVVPVPVRPWPGHTMACTSRKKCSFNVQLSFYACSCPIMQDERSRS
jgi:hypothetical protein